MEEGQKAETRVGVKDTDTRRKCSNPRRGLVIYKIIVNCKSPKVNEMVT